MLLNLRNAEHLLKLLADPTRARLLHLLESEELTVAELAQITQLAQPRISTHLGKLREAGIVIDRKSGVSSYHRINSEQSGKGLESLWHTLRNHTDDPLLKQDQNRLPDVLLKRASEQNWVDSVAGDMERHYSPGRTWEASLRSIVHLLTLGDVLDAASGDGLHAELLAPQSRSVTCVDISSSVVKACKNRLSAYSNTHVQEGNMHHLPFADQSFDVVMLNHALTYSTQPEQALKESARTLRPQGKLLITVLEAHQHEAIVQEYGHVNNGFTTEHLFDLVSSTGLNVIRNSCTAQEKRPPHFRILTLIAEKRPI